MIAQTSTKNSVTRIHEGRLQVMTYPNPRIPVKDRYVKEVTFPVNFGLDYYVIGKVEQYAINIQYGFFPLDYPSILPIEGKLIISTNNGHEITLVSKISHCEDCSAGYFPISEDQLVEICSGVSKLKFDVITGYNGSIKSEIRSIGYGADFTKKMSKYYNSILKKKQKIRISNSNFTTNNPANILNQYHGYITTDFAYDLFLKDGNLKHDKELASYFTENKKDIFSFFNAQIMQQVLEVESKQLAAGQQAQEIEFQKRMNALDQLSADLKRINTEFAAKEKAKKQQQQAQTDAYWARQRAQAANQEAKQKEELARVYGGSSSLSAQMNAEKNKSQTRNMGTSDLAQYNATRMSDATYGTAATNQALAQQRQYNAQQNQQARINQQRSLDQQLGITENAITSSGVPIQIKVNNGIVTAYSTSQNNYSGTGPNWQTVNAFVSRTSDNRYGYEANLGGGIGKVYWGEPSPAINNNIRGVAVNAVTANGSTIQIRVENEIVVAYRTSANLPWNTKSVSAKKTNVTYDGEQIASRFKYKAELPEIGTVYF